MRIIREAQEQLSARPGQILHQPVERTTWTTDIGKISKFLKSNLLTSVEQQKALECMAYTMKKSQHFDYEIVKGYLIKEARDVEDSVRYRTLSKQNSNSSSTQ